MENRSASDSARGVFNKQAEQEATRLYLFHRATGDGKLREGIAEKCSCFLTVL